MLSALVGVLCLLFGQLSLGDSAEFARTATREHAHIGFVVSLSYHLSIDQRARLFSFLSRK